ncbi:uncharacterized protein LOC124188985 [Daphnia pulex]|uniref:uncharacterized protein LOC124188985 n=1 Tax=Daphnia pulex TaxID=6669 RepID=UPI001EE13DBB|nr:uncharacterized protein LOC124188985 [Daphnia pulex]
MAIIPANTICTCPIPKFIQLSDEDFSAPSQRIHQIDRRAAEELKLLEKLAWNQLLLDLANPAFVPDYNLACQRRNHEIYKERNASLLAVKVFDLIHPPSTANREKRIMLQNYLNSQSNKNEVMQKLLSALDKFIGREISNGITRNHVLTIDGEASVVLKKIASSVKLGGCRKIVIKAERVIYLDCDWKVPGISVTLTAPLIHVCSPGVGTWTIDTSGRNGTEHEHLKADDGNGKGGSGNHGLAGQDGEDAGNVNICCQDFKGFLKIVARGGKGADGQDGGTGQPGSKGYDGRDGVTPSDQKLGKNWYTLGDVRGITERVYSDSGLPGKRGGDGGSGGNGGKGGLGGLSGQVQFVSSHHRSTDSSKFILQDCTSGKDGKNGQPGHGAAGGSGGKDGLDAFLYFEPNDNRPYFWNTGYWRSHMGSRTDLEIVRWDGDGCNIGHKIRSSSSRRNQATEGKRGTEGQKAACQQQRQRSSNATTHQTASQFHSHHQTGSDEYERERKRQAEARRHDEREKANERESINRMSREVVGERNAVSRHEGALAADRQRLERMDEIRQRVQAKIQETFEQRIAHQSVVGQRITRQMKLNFEDENLLGLPASRIPTNFASDVRSGRSVYGESTAALRCLAEIDALVMSIMMSKGDDSNLLTLKIPQAVQSLVLKLKFDKHEKEWESIEKIVSKVSSHPLKLADSLEFIASHLPLIISLADQSPASCNLIEILLAFLASTGQEAAEKNAIRVLHEFHQRPIPVQQVIVLLGCISDWTQQSQILLGLFLDKWILTNLTKTIFGAIGNKELRQPRASLFTEVWLQCSPMSKWTKSAAPSSDAENEWLKHVDQFVSELSKALDHENSIAMVDKLLLPFARDRLGIPQDISKIDVKDRWQLVFIIDHMSPEVDEMDAIGRWARKNCDRHLMALVERAFSERFVAPIWSQMQLLLSEKWTKDGKVNEDVGEAIRQLKTSIQSSFTSLSFKERLQLGRALKEKLDGADKKPRQFLDWIKPLSEKVEASTAELFVSRKNDARQEVEIISSLLADSKKFEKKNVILELHFRLSHLSASFEPSQIVEVASILFNKSADRPITDHFNSYHWHCFRSTFLEKWSNYFFLRWSKCNEQTEHLRNVIAERNPEDDDRSLNSLELALERYLLFTAGLPPLEAVQKWLQLPKQSKPQDRFEFIANDLKQAVKAIASTITPIINQLYSNELLCMTKKGKYVGEDIVALTDVLFEIISVATVPFFDDAESVRSLLVVIEVAQLMMELITDDAKNTSSQLISSAKLGEWKKKLVQWKVLDSEAQSMVHFAVKELVKTAESKSSSEDDCSREIYDRMAVRRRNMLHAFNQALSWLEMFVGYLANSRFGIDTLTVIKATIASSQFLSCNGLKNEKTSLLRAAIDIFVACTSIPNNLSEISWSSFFDAILNLNISEKPIGLITTLANFVGGQLSSDRKRATWFMARRWVLLLDDLINHTRRIHDTSPTAADGQNINHWKEMMGIQQVLVDYCSACYVTKLLADSKKCPNKKVDLNLVCFTFKNFVDRWTNIVRFVRPNNKTASSRVESETEFMIDQLETRQLVLMGLIQLGQSDSFYWDEKTANHVLNGFLIPGNFKAKF